MAVRVRADGSDFVSERAGGVHENMQNQVMHGRKWYQGICSAFLIRAESREKKVPDKVQSTTYIDPRCVHNHSMQSKSLKSIHRKLQKRAVTCIHLNSADKRTSKKVI